MSVSGGPDIVQDGLVFCVDTFNPTSYTSGSANWRSVMSPVTASVRGIVTDGSQFIGNPLVVSSSSNSNGGTVAPIVLPISSSVPDIYFDSRASRFTLSVWAAVHNIDAVAAGSSNRGIFARGSNAGGFAGMVGITANKATTSSAISLAVDTRGTAQGRGVTLTSSIQTGSAGTASIFNAVLVYDSSSMSGYLNGTFIGSVTTAVETLFFTGSNWRMNAYGGAGGNGGAGTMSLYLATIHNRALTAQEVLQNYNAQRSRYGV